MYIPWKNTDDICFRYLHSNVLEELPNGEFCFVKSLLEVFSMKTSFSFEKKYDLSIMSNSEEVRMIFLNCSRMHCKNKY